MLTLVIHAPDRAAALGASSFEQILSTGIGPGYAISKRNVDRLAEAEESMVVLLRKDRRLSRAEGQLDRLVPTGTCTPQGIRRYDVHICGLHLVPYRSQRLNHQGVAVY